jgi:hypothetical protein
MLALSIAVALFFEWHTDEVTVVLAAMLLLAMAIGAARPQNALLGGAVLGYSIAAAHAISEAAGIMRPRYMHALPSTGDWIAMLLAGTLVAAVAWSAGILRNKMESGGHPSAAA